MAAADTAAITPLLADDGSVMPSRPDAVPADHGARTRAGRYATREQAALMDTALGDRLIRVRLGCCSSEQVDLAVGVAIGLQVAHELPSDAVVLVDSVDLRLGAAAVHQLEAEGFKRVWLVTP